MESQPEANSNSLDQLTWANFTFESQRVAKMLEAPEIIEPLGHCTNIPEVLDKIRELSTPKTVSIALMLREALRVAIIRQSLPIDNVVEFKIAEPLIGLIKNFPEIAGLLFTRVQQDMAVGRIDVAYSFSLLLGMSLAAGGITKIDNLPGISQTQVESMMGYVHSVYNTIQQQANLQFQRDVA